jgi:hypothetical protein
MTDNDYGVFSSSSWSAPVPGRSSVKSVGPLEIVENSGWANIAAAEDGRAPYFEIHALVIVKANCNDY